MPRKVFYSFHYDNDSWRVSQIRNMGSLEENEPATSNKWEEVKRGGDAAIKKWIDDNMINRTCLIVLIGNATANRKWIDYEIKKAWNDGRAILGIYIHNLKNHSGLQASIGENPFVDFDVDKVSLNTIVRSYDPPYTDSKLVYNHIRNNIEEWIEEAISIRNKY